jgi:hypothetical protein
MKISIRHRRTYSLAVFCALTSVFLILYGCGGGGDGGGVVSGPGPGPGPKVIKVEGYKYLNLIDNGGDNSVRYRAQVQIKDPSGGPVTDNTLVKSIQVFDDVTLKELPTSGSIIFFDGRIGSFADNGTMAPSSQTDVEMYLDAAPGTVLKGFYNVRITDSNGNVYSTYVYSAPNRVISRASGLKQVINPDNSVTLSWTNPPEITPDLYGEHLVYIQVFRTLTDGSNEQPLVANRSLPTVSYTIPASFIVSNLKGKAGLRWRVDVRQRTPAAITFPDNTITQPQFYRKMTGGVVLTLP